MATRKEKRGSTSKASRGWLPADRLRPWLLGAICALFVARPLFPSEAAHQGDGLPVVMLWIVLAVLWVSGAIARPQFRLRFGWTDAAVLLLIGWHTIAGLWAAKHVSPRPAVNMLWEWIALGLAFFLARQLIAGRREARAVMVVMIALAVALSGYGLCQYFYELPNTRAQYAADPDGMLRAQGLWYPPGSLDRQLFESRLESTEPFGTFALANSLAGYLSPWLVVLAGVGIGGGLSRKRLWVGVGVGCAGLLIAACLLLTKSRSGWLATGVGVALVWLLCREGKRLGWKLPAGAAALGAVLVVAAVLSGGLDREVLFEARKSLGYRVQYWQSTLEMIGDRPLVGCGPGNFQNAYTAYKLPEASEEVADPHNFLLEVWATAGTPAMLALLAVLGCFFWASSVGTRSHAPRGNGSPPAEPQSGVPTRSVGTREVEEGTGDSPAHVLGGAACGFLLAWPLGLISANSPGVTALLLGLPLAAGCVALLAGWVYEGRLPAALPAIGVAVLLVNLLAAGGIGFPGVAGSLWLLLAVGLNTTRADRPPWRLPRISAVALLVVVLALGAGCYLTAYRPVLCCQSKIQSALRAWSRGKPAVAENDLLAAEKADRLAAGPWQQLTAMALRHWQDEGTDEAFRRFQRYLEPYNDVLDDLAPNSSRAWLEGGDLHRQAYSKTGDRSDILNAVEAYSRAVKLYPNSGLCRAELALAHQDAGDLEAFRREADRALELDEQTPHADKKLKPEIRRQLLPR
jgi:O-antigen ligase